MQINMKTSRLAPLLVLLGTGILAADPAGRRLEVLFFGAPTANHPGHDPVTRYRVLKKNLGTRGINLTYVQDSAEAFDAGTLPKYDAVLMYGNWNTNGPLPAAQLSALRNYVNDGGAFLPVHCASSSFGGSPEFISLVGGRFKEHGGGVFKVTNVNPAHPIMAGYSGYQAWDETYVHDHHAMDRSILETRGEEPWSWVREQGKGRVFYTAAGHDHQVWDLPEFQDFLDRAILWSVGPEKAKLLEELQLPKLEEEEVQLPGYLKRKLITRAQKPLPPAESMKLAQVPVDFELSLFAAEPDIVNPIFISWDERGRAFIVQTVDYPNNLHSGNLGNDRISIAEDTDGDGKADKFTTFADKLSIPTSLAFANGGVICTNGSEMLLLKDTDGDDKADVRQVLFHGFGMGDTHAGVSNLTWCPDGWIYATVGYSGFDGEVGGEKFSFSQTVFRFKPDGSKMEELQDTTNNTWGLGITPDFDVMGSTANSNPSFYLTFPKADYTAAGLRAPRTPRADDNPPFNPSSTDIRQVDQFDKYTAGAGHAFYTSTRFPESWRDKTAFVCEPTGKLVGVFDTRREGAAFKSTQRFNNIYNSADAWSAPVCAQTGPDGAVWVCDWYNLIIQHNPQPSKASSGLDATTGKGNAYDTPLRDKQHGRIYRISPKGSRNDSNPGLDPMATSTLLSGLDHPNLFWRLQAQRLIVEGNHKELASKLQGVIRSGGKGPPHALHALAELGLLDAAMVDEGLASPVRSIRRAALRYAAPEQARTLFLTDGATASFEARELAELLVLVSRATPDGKTGAALFDFATRQEQAVSHDPVMKDAWQIAANRHAPDLLAASLKAGFDAGEEPPPSPNLLPNPDFSKIKDGMPEQWGTIRTHSGAGVPDLKVSSSPGGRDGTPCLKIECPKQTDSGPMITIKVEKHLHYHLSGWIRTENVVPSEDNAPGAMLYISGIDKSTSVKGTSGWKQVFMDFDSEDNTTLRVMCLLGGYGGATGTAWFDDVSLVENGGGSGIHGMMRAVAKHQQAKEAPAATASARKFPADPAVHARGKQIYGMTCVACHQPDAKGMAGAFPPLDGSAWLTGDPSVPIRVLLHGLAGPIKVAGQDFNGVMPAHVALDNSQIADVLTYVRQNWSNDAAPVTPEIVGTIREQFKARTAPWTASELEGTRAN